MTVEELLEHADRLEGDLLHKIGEIQRREFSPYTEATLVRQCDALRARVDEIRHGCAVAQVRAAALRGEVILAA